MELNALREYEFTDFTQDVELLEGTHTHSVRREPHHTFVDRWAKELIINSYPELYRQSIQGWSRSYYDPERHMEAIRNYAVPNIPITNIDINMYRQCSDVIRIGFHGLPRVRAFDVLTELDLVKYKPSTAAGYGYLGAKGEIGGQNHDTAVRRARAIIGDIADHGVKALEHAIITMVPDIGHTRTQLANIQEKTKVRNVWGRAFHYILLEGLTAYPLIQTFMHSDTFYHIGKDPLDSVPIVISEALNKGRWLYAIDWKQFDATVNRFEINTAFNLIRELIDFPNIQTEIAFELSRQLFIHKKIAAPDGKFYWVHKGVPSGSYFTSIIGSIVNRLRIEYLWRKIKGTGPKVCYTQGDDSISSDDSLIPPEDFARVANEIGWIFNPEKTEYSTVPSEVTFLGRTIMGGSNLRDTLKCIRLLVYPEYEVKSPQISAYRARSIADDAGGRSAILNQIADKLQAYYGVASEEDIPPAFKRYVM